MVNKEECNYIDVARFIGIYLVILGHFPFSENTVCVRNIIYAFHMPLFFFISGYLHKETSISIKAVKKLSYSLIVPYVIYNALYFIPYFILNDYNFTFGDIKNIFLVRYPINIPTWFFISLFWIKIFSMFCGLKRNYILVSMLCIGLTYTLHDLPYKEIFGIKASFMAFPFFSAGFLLKKMPLKQFKRAYSCIFITILALFLIGFVKEYGGVNLYKGIFKNIVLYYAIGIVISLATVYLANIIPFKNKIIRIVSRGTMFIVGSHWIIIIFLFKYLPNLNVVLSAFISLIITFLYYFPIRYISEKIPILNGKTWRKSTSVDRI